MNIDEQPGDNNAQLEGGDGREGDAATLGHPGVDVGAQVHLDKA